LIRDTNPKALRRNYSIGSVGVANSDVLANYVARQPENHPMADRRVQERIEALQFHDSGLDFGRERFSSHGRFVHNLHVVLENEGGWHDTRAEVLIRSRQMIIDSAKKHS